MSAVSYIIYLNINCHTIYTWNVLPVLHSKAIKPLRKKNWTTQSLISKVYAWFLLNSDKSYKDYYHCYKNIK